MLLAKWSGIITLEAFKDNYFDYLSDVNYRPGRTELIDQREFQDFEGDFQAVRAALSFVNASGDGLAVQTRTVVLATDEGVYGLGRMYQQLADLAQGIRVEVFTNEAEALRALHLPYKTIEEMRMNETFLPSQRSPGTKAPFE